MKNLVLVLLLFLGVQMNASTPKDAIKFYDIKNVKIPVVYEQSNLLPTGFVQLVFIGGGNVNDGNKIGLSKIASSILNEGTKELGVTKFADLLEQKAINLNVRTGLETLNFELDYLKDEQNTAINLMSDLLKSPNLTENALKKVRTQITSALLNKQNDFDYIASVNLSSLLFKNTPLANPALGTIKSIQNISLDDVKKYLKENLTLKRLIIILGGDMDIDKTLALLKPVLSTLEVGEKAQTHHYEANDKSQEKTIYKDTQQAYIYFGSPFSLNDLKTEAYKAKVMSFILGSSGFGSRLMEEIRVKRGLAYSAYLRIATSNIANYTTGYLQTKIENQKESIELVKKVVDDFIKNGATQEELDSAKSFLLGSEPLRNETLSQRLYTKFFNFYLGLPLDFEKIQLNQIKNLTLDELNSYIKSHTEIKNLTFSIVTQKSQKDKK
ncbi:M16 family metallopeptidase [Helicobacter cappadocius]|uniref:Pitrilysin family protein n=1 Tax=Helicobacter cappadocius TaxID=3063998 RepID=A0AA90PIM6_9HELI|nr:MULTISPECIES: pitrilysin family protein [unclassified Helicobacter]MDO7252408.1 pitrilysin family protein [Helicobacter sp. faydin-H75]MDP2538275.1 pitrilysin family protein [Helicobacter sp. faydin-H76]